MAEQIRVVVVDDSSFMRGALVRMIERDPRFKVVDVAANGREGVDKVQALRPDVVTMDVEMPVMNGLEALEAIMASTRTPVVMVSTLTEAGAATTLKALELGAVDFVPKALNDKDNNIFRGAEGLHEKLLMAAAVRNGRPAGSGAPALVPPPLKVAPPPSSHVARVDAGIVIVGSSTGGPRALQAFLSALPRHLPVPVVIAQHMPAPFTLALARRLDETCPPEVVEARHGDVLQPGRVYIGPGGFHVRVGHAGLSVDQEQGESPYKPSVDVLAGSALAVFGQRVLAVMLTGMGNDGTREFVNVRRAGGYVIAQDQNSSVVYGMPRAVLEAGGVNEVLPLAAIGQRVRSLLGS